MVGWRYLLRTSLKNSLLLTYALVSFDPFRSMTLKTCTRFVNVPLERETSCTISVMQNKLRSVRFPSFASCSCNWSERNNPDILFKLHSFSLYDFYCSSSCGGLEFQCFVLSTCDGMDTDCSRTNRYVLLDVKIDGQRRGSYGSPLRKNSSIVLSFNVVFRRILNS